MLAGRITAPRKLELIEVTPPPCREGEATVRLEIGCLCGSDLPYFAYDFDALHSAGRTPCANRVNYDGDTAYPLKTGLSLHECVGTVVESRSDLLAAGDFVLALPFDQIGFFEYLTLPANRIFKLPAGTVTREELLLSQPLGTVDYAFRKMPDVAGRTVAVVGQGPIGLMMNIMLARQGAGRIIAIEKVPERLARSATMGATDVIDGRSADIPNRILEMNGGELADVVVEAVGHSEQAIDLCADLVRQDGHILVFGVIDTPHVDRYPYGKIFYKNLTVAHSVSANRAEHFLPSAKRIASGEIDVSPLITHRFPVAQAQQAYETFVDRRDGAIKVLLDFA